MKVKYRMTLKAQNINTFGNNTRRKHMWLSVATLVVLVVLSIGAMAACSANTGNGTGLPTKYNVKTSQLADFKAFESRLEKAGINYDKKEMKKTANLIEAICGARYQIADGTMTIFKFDATNENYIRIYNSNDLIIHGDEGDIHEPVVAYRGIVIYVRGITNADLVKHLMVYASDVWHK